MPIPGLRGVAYAPCRIAGPRCLAARNTAYLEWLQVLEIFRVAREQLGIKKNEEASTNPRMEKGT